MKSYTTIVTALFSVIAFAQTINNADLLGRCPRVIGSLDPNARFNTTGQQYFTYSTDERRWFLTMTLNDTRSTSLTRQLHDLQGYISVPNTTTGSACAYMLPGVDIGFEDGKSNMGCSRVISQTCSQYLQNRMRKPLETVDNQERCPETPSRDDLKGPCGETVGSGWKTSLLQPIEFSNKTCTASQPVSQRTPDNYITFAAMGIGMPPGESDRLAENTTWYSKYVRQSRPWVITKYPASGDIGQVETRVVCVAPRYLDREGTEPNVTWTPPANLGSSHNADVIWLSLIVGAVALYLAS